MSFGLLAYLPHYVAMGLGAFEAEGLNVTLTAHAGSWSELITAGEAATSDIVVGNLWFAMLDWGHRNQLLPIAHCVQQCGSIMVAKRSDARRGFDWSALAGRTVAMQSDVPTPWVAFQESLALKGLSVNDVRTVLGFDTRAATNAVIAGAVDFAILHVDRIQDASIEEVAALADVIGPVPWSVYFANRSRVEEDPGKYRRFQRAIATAQHWMGDESRPSAEILEIARRWAPGIAPDTATRIVDRYRSLHAWPVQPEIRVEDAERWQRMLVTWGLLPDPVALGEMLAFANQQPAAGAGLT